MAMFTTNNMLDLHPRTTVLFLFWHPTSAILDLKLLLHLVWVVSHGPHMLSQASITWPSHTCDTLAPPPQTWWGGTSAIFEALYRASQVLLHPYWSWFRWCIGVKMCWSSPHAGELPRPASCPCSNLLLAVVHCVILVRFLQYSPWWCSVLALRAHFVLGDEILVHCALVLANLSHCKSCPWYSSHPSFCTAHHLVVALSCKAVIL